MLKLSKLYISKDPKTLEMRVCTVCFLKGETISSMLKRLASDSPCPYFVNCPPLKVVSNGVSIRLAILELMVLYSV